MGKNFMVGFVTVLFIVAVICFLLSMTVYSLGCQRGYYDGIKFAQGKILKPDYIIRTEWDYKDYKPDYRTEYNKNLYNIIENVTEVKKYGKTVKSNRS